ncbi:MAG: pyrophosphokinae [Burkholderiales bacterium]|nr:pyrophosphokinae [Burkholderiales bacterium]
MVTVKHEFHDSNSWLEIQKKYFTPVECEQFQLAIEIAKKYYTGQKFYPTNATILFSISKFCPDDWREKLAKFDPKVTELIDGVTRVIQIRKLGTLADVENEDEKRAQVEVVRKMLLAMVSDIRVVLILLVGRGELMLHLKSCKDTELVHKIAVETVEIFSPLANRLGVWQIKWELEDLSFKYLHPEQYKKIARLLDETREERLEYIENIKQYLSNQMQENGIKDYQVSGRAKHIYSIWKKMSKKNYDFDDLYDIRAVRVLVPEVRDCYTVLGILHTKYSPVPGEFDDYISNPKPNNYQSLHTCVTGPDDRIIEIQIRTFAMHTHAEYGVAAHWRYKEFGEKNIENNAAFAEKLAWLRQILDWRDELTDHKDITDIFKNEIFKDTIYVMTPNGKVISLPNGSTPVDFAYAVHSAVGHKCRGAKVDGQIVPLATSLKNGQRVEILTVKTGGPSINWIHDGLVKSPKAISHIRRYIREQNYEEFFSNGKEIFERELSKFPAIIRPALEEIISALGYTDEKNICVDLGRGDLSPVFIRETISKLIKKEQESTKPEDVDLNTVVHEFKSTPVANRSKQLSGIMVDGVSGIVTYVAKCCKPLPGDSIIGFITQGNGVAIHRNNCIGIKRQAKNFPQKVVQVSWGEAIDKAVFNVDIEVIANDRSGLLRDLTDLFAREKINIDSLRTAAKNNRAIMVFTIQIHGGNFDFTPLINRIFTVSGVLEVMRK